MSITNKDLRISNKLQKDNGQVFTVLRIDNTNDVLVEEQRGLLTLNYNLHGIPLTPELLQALGFGIDPDYVDNTYVNGYHVNLNDHFFISQTKDGWYCKCIAPNLEIKYVHQLQNIFHSLTGQELTLPESLHP